MANKQLNPKLPFPNTGVGSIMEMGETITHVKFIKTKKSKNHIEDVSSSK